MGAYGANISLKATVRTPRRGWDGWKGACSLYAFSVLPLDTLWRLVEEESRPMVDDDPFTCVYIVPFVRVCVRNTVRWSGIATPHTHVSQSVSQSD